MTQKSKYSSKRYPTYKRNGKRMKKIIETLDELDICPTRALIRNALKAEDAKQYSVAIRGRAEILNYLQPKYKAIDPLEQAAKAKDVLSLQQLQHMKEAVMTGDINKVQEAIPVVEEGQLL